MSASHVPGTLATVLDSFGGLFGRPTFRTFVSLVLGWILCRGRHTITRVILAARATGADGHHARFYRFFAKSVWRGDVDELGRRVLALLLPLLPRTIELIVDDTLCRKGGPQVFGARNVSTTLRHPVFEFSEPPPGWRLRAPRPLAPAG